MAHAEGDFTYANTHPTQDAALTRAGSTRSRYPRLRIASAVCSNARRTRHDAMSITRRQIFENLTLARGRELARQFALDGMSGLDKQALVDALSRKRSLAPATVLGALSRDELKALCDGLGVDRSGREKRILIDRLLNGAAGVRDMAPSYVTRAEPEAGTTRRTGNVSNTQSLEAWIWNAACSIRGARDAPKYKDYILPLIFTKRLCNTFATKTLLCDK
jgi:hypothetical protein